MASRKKGQVEDMFADFLPSLIILIITIVVISKVDASHRAEIGSILEKVSPIVDKITPILILKSPLETNGTKEAGLEGMDFLDFLNHLSRIKETDTEKRKKLRDNKIVEMRPITGQNVNKYTRKTAFGCRENLYLFMTSYMFPIEYGTWVFRVFETDSQTRKKGGLLFFCTGAMYEYAGSKAVKYPCDDYCSHGCFNYEYPLINDIYSPSPIGGKYGTSNNFINLYETSFNIPSPDPSKEYLVMVAYSDKDFCPRRL